MRYKTERDLQIEIASLDFGLVGFPDISYVRREVPVGGCIPDLVTIGFYEMPSTEYWPNNWSYKHSYVIWLLRQWKRLTAETIASLSFESLHRVKPIIQDLVESGAAVQTESGALILSKAVASIQAEVIAVEAKLRRWREALDQAIEYKTFADRVFVAMDSFGAPTEDGVLRKFFEYRVGLCAITTEGVEWLVYPRSNKQKRGHAREYLVTSAIVPSRQTLWSRRNPLKASSQD
jgi:hypothetical protein